MKAMKIIIENPSEGEEETIILRCRQPDERLLQFLNNYNSEYTNIPGYDHDKMTMISYKDVYYFESVENRVYAYCEEKVYEVKNRLYELEQNYQHFDFMRCSKSMILNIAKIDYLAPMFNGRLEAVLKNNEKVIISRQYVPYLKANLGLSEGGK